MHLRTVIATILFCVYSLHAHPFEIIDHGSCIDIHTEYGSTVVYEPVLIDLLRSPGFNRLNHIEQYGTVHYAREEKGYSRFEHSVGVFVILRLFNASLEEQIAGLLHDASHTVFSHVADHLFSFDKKLGAYQDTVHEWALEQLDITAILEKYQMKHACSAQLKESLRALKQPYPDLCADRIEYNLKGGLFENILSEQDITHVITHLYLENGNWYLTSPDAARTIAYASLFLCETIWGAGAWNFFIYQATANALKHAMYIELISHEEIHFSTDALIWHKLKTSQDPVIQQLIDHIEHYNLYITESDATHFDIRTSGKFSGVDPLIKTENGFTRLSAIDANFKAEYERVKKRVADGGYILLTQHTAQLPLATVHTPAA